jgi:Co/Zn/Cd efflux system component
MDGPVASLIWSRRDCGLVIRAWFAIREAIWLDMTPDHNMAERIRALIETDGDQVTDLHLWRLGPAQLGAIISVETQQPREPQYYPSLFRRFGALSHVAVQVQHR